MVRLVLPESASKQAEVLGRGAEAAPAVVRDAAGDRGRLMLLALIEDPADELSQQAVAFARRLGDEVERGRDRRPGAVRARGLGADGGRADRSALGRRRSSPPALTVATRSWPTSAAKLDQPMAANCVSVTPGSPATVVRVRWGGSLLEEARLHGAPLLADRCRRMRSPPQPIGDVETVPVSRLGLRARPGRAGRPSACPPRRRASR